MPSLPTQYANTVLFYRPADRRRFMPVDAMKKREVSQRRGDSLHTSGEIYGEKLTPRLLNTVSGHHVQGIGQVDWVRPSLRKNSYD